MFYVDDYEITTIVLGHGDTKLQLGIMRDDGKSGSLSFVDNCGICHEIGESHDMTGQTDDQVNTTARIVFGNIESIDVMINVLERVKEVMKEQE